MSYIVNEKFLNKSLKPLNIQSTETILYQMKNCVCQICKNDSNRIKGTGFFCKIWSNYFLVTNNHIINSNDIARNIEFLIVWNKDNYRKIKLDSSRKVFTDENFDITFIEIKRKDNIKYFLEVDDQINKDEKYLNDLYSNLYILNYPGNNNNIVVSYGKLKSLVNNEIEHLCNTEGGSSGSPILSLHSHKVIGIHRGTARNREWNIGVIFKVLFYIFNNQKNNIKFLQKNKSFNQIPFNCQFYKNNNDKIINEKTIEDGIYNIIPSYCENMVFDINGGGQNNKANLQIYEYNSSKAQQFEVKYNSLFKFYIIKCLCSNKLLTVDFNNNYNIMQLEQNQGNIQHWYIASVGDCKYEIISVINNQYLMDVNGKGNSSGTNISCCPKTGGLNQQFKFKKITFFEIPSSYSGCSIVDALKSINSNSSYEFREEIAKVNGMKDYTGKPSENDILREKLNRGELIKP